MKINRNAIIAAAVAMFAAVPMVSHAADGTITFNGSITDQTCNINATGGKDFAVTLPTVSSSQLAAPGLSAGRTPFSISLSGCSTATGNVHTFFESGSTTDPVTGYLALDAGGADNVKIRVLNGSDASPIKAGFADGTQGSKSVALVGGAATLPYFAEYVTTGVAGSGSANSSVMYSIAYE
ncbi:fimbrial protein [Paraburkholderia ginsengisoli]|uniref:Type 1 fimbrial protein n=2 Tax=Paraburkholderia ginsengisoli TaxID=311231 RepID=A0A7T4TC32_9BURK|nr:type 1 fimbrial protein [Paraburkholderia ginsengisoli]